MDKKQRNRIEVAAQFLEELSWVLDTKKVNSLKELPTLLRQLLEDDPTAYRKASNLIEKVDRCKTSLIGLLPGFFMDKEIFPDNASILRFADEALGISLSAKSKRSRYELIGQIVCSIQELDDATLNQVVDALLQMQGNQDKLSYVRKNANQDGFSWNRAIQEMTGGSE